MGQTGMPDAIRTTVEGFWARPPRSGFRAALAVLLWLPCDPVSAQSASGDYPISLVGAYIAAFALLGQHELAALALMLGILCFAVVTAILLVRTRRRLAQVEGAARDESIAAKAAIDRAYALLLCEPQILVIWAPAPGAEPEIVGEPPLVVGERPDVLAFASWLPPEAAREMERCVDALRARGVGFTMMVTAISGQAVEAEGRVIGARAILRLRLASGIKSELAQLRLRHEKQTAETDAIRTLIETLVVPIWARDAAGAIVFANPAYARAVEAKTPEEAVEGGIELFDRPARGELLRAHEAGQHYARRLPAVVAGERHSFDVIAVPAADGSIGIALDVTEAELMRAEFNRMIEAHRRTLDQLATGVAIFGSDRRLGFYNAAYRTLWGLDAAFLNQRPTDSAVLDQLRAARKLPDEQDFRQWKAALFEAYRAPETNEHTWHLPDGRTIRVVTTPNPEGGVTYLFDDVTERLDLERRYDALIRVQRETLDNLNEAVAVFASDGRLRLHNPAFARLWQLAPELLSQEPHVETVSSWSRSLHNDQPIWQRLRATITAIDVRSPIAGRLERADGSLVDCASTPLPDGATLVTFQDVTDTVNVERALRERNEALEAADKLKIDFVHHVSYELRSPLTNIIGFAHFLSDPVTGPLTPKQREYLGYITASTNALLAIINNILDLATVDAGAMTLNLGSVDIRATMEAAAEGVQDRLIKSGIILDIRVASDIGTFVADEWRVRQSLFNLLANAVGFSPPGRPLFSPLTASRMPSCFRSPIAVPAFRRKYRARCSIGSKPTPSAHGIGAPVSDSRWCARSSSCTAGPCDWSRLQVAARR